MATSPPWLWAAGSLCRALGGTRRLCAREGDNALPPTQHVKEQSRLVRRVSAPTVSRGSSVLCTHGQRYPLPHSSQHHPRKDFS